MKGGWLVLAKESGGIKHAGHTVWLLSFFTRDCGLWVGNANGVLSRRRLCSGPWSTGLEFCMFPVGRVSGLSIIPCSPRAVYWTDPRAGWAAWHLVATWEESITPACELWGVLNMKATQRTDSFVQSFLCLSFQCIFSIIFEVNSPCSYKDELNKKDEAFLCHHFGLECQSWERS